MPIYEFECGKCDDIFEAMRSVSDDTAPSCPACGSTRVTKLVSAFGIARPGLKLGSLSPVERSRAEKEIRRRSRGRCCDSVCDPPGS
jgi:putative FmdB family regulatory protein